MPNSRPQANRGQKQRTRSIYTDEYKHFINKLVEARKAAGLTQEEVAERIGQTQAFVSRCEQGQRRLDIIELRAFLRVFGIAFDEFVITLNHELSEEEANHTDLRPNPDNP